MRIVTEIIALVFLFLHNPAVSFAQTASQAINFQVQISVCGNSVIEGGEACEGLDLGGESCISLGYASGDLVCDLACTFDTTACVPVTPTPTPSPTATPNTDDDDSSDEAAGTLVSSILDFFTVPPSEEENQSPAQITLLPASLQQFDIYGLGVLRRVDLEVVLQKWVDGWKEQTQSLAATFTSQPENAAQVGVCDLNQDTACNLIDFSILLHYIES